MFHVLPAFHSGPQHLTFPLAFYYELELLGCVKHCAPPQMQEWDNNPVSRETTSGGNWAPTKLGQYLIATCDRYCSNGVGEGEEIVEIEAVEELALDWDWRSGVGSGYWWNKTLLAPPKQHLSFLQMISLEDRNKLVFLYIANSNGKQSGLLPSSSLISSFDQFMFKLFILLFPPPTCWGSQACITTPGIFPRSFYVGLFESCQSTTRAGHTGVLNMWSNCTQKEEVAGWTR